MSNQATAKEESNEKKQESQKDYQDRRKFSKPLGQNSSFSLPKKSSSNSNSNGNIKGRNILDPPLGLPHSRSRSQTDINMRRRKDPRAYYPSNDAAASDHINASNNHQGIVNSNAIEKDTSAYGYFERPSSTPNANTPIRTSTDQGQLQRQRLMKSTQSPSSPTPHPNIADFMPADQKYISFLLSGNHHKSKTVVYHAQNTHPESFSAQPLNLQISKAITIFSFIGTLLLFIFGFIIEVQPLYIKGVSAARTPLSRNLMGQYSKYSWVHFSARLRILNNVTTSKQSTDHQEMNRMMESMGMIFEMKSEAKVAFKTSALYFLVMTLAIIYTHNHVLIHANYQKINLWGKVKVVWSMVPRYLILLLRKYRRRHYNHVHDVHVRGPGVGGPGLGLAKVNINAMSRSKNNIIVMPAGETGSPDDGYDSSLEDLGLSMRERSSDGGGGSGDGTGEGFTSAVLKTIMSKSKKK